MIMNGGAQLPAGPVPRRINVAVTPDTVRALEHVIAQEGVSLTEAVRRLTGYGAFVYQAVARDGMELQLRGRGSA
jgi:hypothetical protein